MKPIVNIALILSLGLLPSAVALSVNQVAYGQTQNSQNEELQSLLRQATQQTQRGESKQAIETFQKALEIARQLKEKRFEATALLGIGVNLGDIGQPQKALEFYAQALLIRREVGDRVGEATTLNNIGVIGVVA